jgi:hypothetical protein
MGPVQITCAASDLSLANVASPISCTEIKVPFEQAEAFASAEGAPADSTKTNRKDGPLQKVL